MMPTLSQANVSQVEQVVARMQATLNNLEEGMKQRLHRQDEVVRESQELLRRQADEARQMFVKASCVCMVPSQQNWGNLHHLIRLAVGLSLSRMDCSHNILTSVCI